MLDYVPSGRLSVSTGVGAAVGTDVVVALITGGAALGVAVAGVPLNYLISRRHRRDQVQDVMARYRDPLLWSVHDFRSRVRTILDEDFLSRYLIVGDDMILRDGDKFM